MRVLVVGAGAVGLWLGGRLAQAGHRVTFVARGLTWEALRLQGLRLVRNGEEARVASFSVVPGVAAAFADHSGYDLCCLTVKAYDAGTAAEELRAATGRPPPVVTFQNGVGSQEQVARVLGEAMVIIGTLTTPVTVPAPATVQAGGGPRRGIGLSASHPSHNLEPIAEAFRQAGFPTHIYPDHQAMLWSKLLLNMMANATCAILDMTPGEVYADPRLFAIEHRALLETLAVMRARGARPVNLPGYPVGFLVPWLEKVPPALLRPLLERAVVGGRGGKMPSMHLDLSRGKGRTEVRFLNGAVARCGPGAGVPTPVNEMLTQVLEGLAAGRLARDEFRRRPERLLGELAKRDPCEGLKPSQG